MQISKAELHQNWMQEKRKKRKKILLLVALTAVVFWVCICFQDTAYLEPGEHAFLPGEYMKELFWRIVILFSGIFKGTLWHTRLDILENLSLGVVGNIKVTLMGFVAGAGLAVAGGIFQTVYKNPMASPNMLGATTGVQLGNVLMVAMYSSQAMALIGMRYRICYLLTAICVGVILLLGKLPGDRTGNPSVMKMVMAGSIINQGIGTVTMYLMYQLKDEDLLTYQQIGMGTYIDTDLISLLIFFTIMGVALLPMLFLRYQFNVTGIDDAEARVAGVNPSPYRMVGQICGVLMVTAAVIHCGQAGMLTMVIPYIVRNAIGSDFRRVFAYSAMFGGMLMMVCRTVTRCVALHNAAGDLLLDANWDVVRLPATFIVNICLLPFFLMILARQRRAFD